MSCPAVFVDKDGTLVEDVPYNVDRDRIRLLPGAAAAIRGLNMITQKLGGRPSSGIISMPAWTAAQAQRIELELMLDLVML